MLEQIGIRERLTRVTAEFKVRRARPADAPSLAELRWLFMQEDEGVHHVRADFLNWKAEPDVPTLHLRAGDVPGDHTLVLDEHVATTASAMRAWLQWWRWPGRLIAVSRADR